MANVFRNVTKGSLAKGTGFLTVLAAAVALDLSRWGLFGFVLTGIPLWCFGVVGSAGGIMFHLAPMLFGSASTEPPRSTKTTTALFLYLRPFELDARSSMQLMVGASAGVVVYLGLLKGLWWPMAFAPLIINISKEQNFQHAFGLLGDFIAFGHPKEWLQPIGASRVYAQGDWQLEIKQLMSQARVVIVRPGNREGIKWEIEQLQETVKPDQIVFYLKFRGWKKRQQREYQSFRDHLQSALPTKLPEQLGKARFLIFDRSWNPQFVEEANRPSQLFQQLFSRSGNITSDNLQPLLKALNLDLPPQPNTLGNNLGTIGLWLAAFFSVGLVLVSITFATIKIVAAFTVFLLNKYS